MTRPWPQRLERWRSIVELASAVTALAPELIAAVMDRESGGGVYLQPQGQGGVGDYGHGRGLMQIDDRYHADWITQKDENGVPLWQQAIYNIPYGAHLLRDCVQACGGVPGGVAAYNADREKVLYCINLYGQDIERLDQLTTGGDYVSDVLTRCALLQHED